MFFYFSFHYFCMLELLGYMLSFALIRCLIMNSAKKSVFCNLSSNYVNILRSIYSC